MKQSAIGHARCINILTSLRGFQDKVLHLFCFFVSKVASKSLLEIERQKKLKKITFWPNNLGAMLECWYIERGLLGLINILHLKEVL